MVIPILSYYVQHFGAGGSAMGGLMATYAVMQFIFAPIWGSLSDQYGRKPILLVGFAFTLATWRQIDMTHHHSIQTNVS